MTDSSSAQASQEDVLQFEDEAEDTGEDIIEETDEISQSHSPTPEEELDQFIFPDNSGYFRIFADKVNEKRVQSLTGVFGSRSKLTVIGLFGKEKSFDSCKAVEIFDYIAQKDIFSVLQPLQSNEVIYTF